jgi:fructose-bisphosphate aldolase class I
MTYPELTCIADSLVAEGKGILAIDESNATCNKRFELLRITPDAAQRRAYRELLLTTPALGRWISGAILYDETIRQSAADGRPFVEIMRESAVLPGIKVDTGTVPLPGTDQELITEGLDGLARRVEEYRALGARFGKWRAVISIGNRIPTDRALVANAHALARYAKISQDGGLVPIVEPEVLTEGAHNAAQSFLVTRRALRHVFEALAEEGVDLRAMILKTNMITQGGKCLDRVAIALVAQLTIEVLSETVPPALAGVAFLSGGQPDVLATQHLQAINVLPKRHRPWPLTFSFGRAIQQGALAAWSGRNENVFAAQSIVAHRSQCNAAASTGSYDESLELRLEPTHVA